MKRVLGALVLTLMVGSLAWAQEPIRIGFQGPLTGPWAIEGDWALKSVQIAVRLINEQGGVLGRPLELVVEDDGGTPKGGVLAAQKLVAAGVKFVVGTYGSMVCMPSSDIYEEAQVVVINYGCTRVDLSARGLRYYFRTSGRDDSQALYFADVVVPLFNAKRVAIMHDNTAYALGVAEDTRKFLQPKVEAGEVEIVYYDAIMPGERDYTPALTALRDTNPDIWYYTGYYPEWALLLRQGMDMGLKTVAVGSNACPISETVNIAGLDAVVGATITQEPLPAFLVHPEATKFVQAYIAEHGSIHDSPWATYAADAVNTIAFAIAATESTDPQVIADYLRQSEVIGTGITGPLAFSPQGDRLGVPYTLLICTEKGESALIDEKTACCAVCLCCVRTGSPWCCASCIACPYPY
jgi:branched-chain amino acid transport system substrate-binding protein